MESEPPKKLLSDAIQIYLRLRPSRTNKPHNHIDIYENDSKIDVKIPLDDNKGYVNNSLTKHSYEFDRIFDIKANQEEMFNEVAKDVIDSTLDGYNGTIFAYGQTGSGKTYTITGGVESISLRGIIPRGLSYIFEETKKRPLYNWKVYVSYLEIYNNDGYDLLHDDSSSNKYELESFPKVTIKENLNHQLILTNLSIHQIDNFQEGMALLMLGDENRVVAETPKNDASTRSHCLFMIQLESQKVGEDKKTLSKLHIVDLSGSEKPSKSNLDAVRMQEALKINLSLHFLESVIIAINSKSKYIPYRNSMMTMCLRDSIGGNCKTRMIANISSDFDDVLESISTCRFAQRVSLIKNIAVVNEIVDPNQLIQKQKAEIEELKNELKVVKGKDQKSFLDKEDLEESKRIVSEFLFDDTFQAKIECKDRLMIQECFNIIKLRYKDIEKKLKVTSGEIVLDGVQNLDKVIELETENKRLTAEIQKLKEMLSNREEEMKIVLKNMEGNNNQPHRTLLDRLKEEDNSAISKIKSNILGDLVKFDNLTNSNMSKINNNNNTSSNDISLINGLNENNMSTTQKTQSVPIPDGLMKDIIKANSYISCPNSDKINFDLLKIRNEAYLFFRNNYYLKDVEGENQNKIKEKMAQGKEVAEEYTKLTAKTQKIKKQIEEIRRIKIVDETKANDEELKKKEDALVTELMNIKPIEKKQKDLLRNLHSDIKTMQTIEDNFQMTRIKHFEFWSEVMLKKIDHEARFGKSDLNKSMTSITNNYYQEQNNKLNMSNISKASELNELTEKIQQKVNQCKNNLNSNN